ncbi:MAG: hypothetical protein JSW68_01530 [Burkholderiales bacterium]|nr:MAG: hypothetical protein JSW68_01530 [Burkholderiales bacterium]
MRALLGFLGRYARWALPVGVFVGIAVPELSRLARPVLGAVVVGTLTAALLRLNWGHLAAALRRPRLPAVITLWQLVLSPLVVWFLSGWLGLSETLRTALLLQAAAPPIGSAAVFALILGLDGVLAVIGTAVSTLLLPLSLTPLVGVLLPQAGIEVDLVAFFVRVLLVVALPFALALGLRRLIGVERLARNDDLLGGINVVLLVMFALALMDGVTARVLSDPAFMARLLLTACVTIVLLHVAGLLVFRATGAASAYTVALLSGNRNMGLMLVVTAGTAGEAFALYVGVAQIPMYFAPLLLSPLVRRAGAHAGGSNDPPAGGRR